MAFSDDATVKALIAQIGVNDPVIASAPPLLVAALLGPIKGSLNDDLGDYGLALAICHELTLTSRSASGSQGVGQVSSEKEGELARSYVTPQMLSTNGLYYNSTAYGLRFWAWVLRTLGPAFGNRMTLGVDGSIPCGPFDCP